MNKINHSTKLQRLSFIKFIYTEGLKQSEMDEPSCAISILTFHDAIENFLLLCAENTQAHVGKFDSFMSYWNKIEKSSGKRLVEEASMNRLNRARNNLKHNGIIPIKLHVNEFRERVISFFEKNTPDFFDISFSDINIDDHKKIDIINDNEQFILPTIEKEGKSILRKIYSTILPTQASRSVYPIYLSAAILTSWIITASLLLFPLNMISDFGLFDFIVWMAFAPVLMIFVIFDPNNRIFGRYIDFIEGDPLTIIFLFILSILYLLIFISVSLLSLEEEKERKIYYPTLLREILEKNGLIGINELAKQLNVSNEVINIWLEIINPNYQIKKAQRHIKTLKRSISNEEIKELMKNLKEAQREVDKIEANKKRNL